MIEFELCDFENVDHLNALRITSYNVCYTKLLRHLRDGPGGHTKFPRC